jgi:L-ribulose-5-phosphate 3-epimerase
MTPLSRRQFLGVSAAAAGVAVLGTRTFAQPPQPTKSKRTLRKAVMYGMIGAGKTIQDKFQILKDNGFAGVEMDSPSNMNLDEVFAAQAKTGIKVHGLVDSKHWQMYLNAPDEKVQAEGVKALETCLRDGKTLGCTSILLVPGIVREGMAYDDCWRLTQQNIRKVLPLAKECNVKIAIENVWNNFILSPMEAAQYVDQFNDPMVAWHFDIGNVINYGWPDQWAKILGKRIAKLHIKDFSRKKRNDEGLWKGFDVELGDGDAGWASVMKALDEVGYSTAPGGNWATAEVGGGDEKRLKTVSDQMDKLFAM